MTPVDRERRRPRLRADRHALIANLLVVACVAAMTIVVLNIESSLRASARRLSMAQHSLKFDRRFLGESCVRLNLLRANDNVSHYADFKVFRVVLIESEAALRARRIPVSSRADEGRFLRELAGAVRAKSWTPLTNCRRAISEKGTAYRAPPAVPFATRLPPRDALYPQPGSPGLSG